MTRWMHPHELERQRASAAFDPVVEGPRYHLSPELSLAIWDRVRRDATDSTGRLDSEQAKQRFHEIAARIAARRGRLAPDIGRLTRVGVELDGGSLDRWRVDEMASRTPGRTTRVIAEARRWRQADGESATARDDAGATAGRSTLPGAREVAEALAAIQATGESQATAEMRAPPLAPHVARRAAEQGPTRLPMAMRDRMERVFGHHFGNVEIHPNSAEVATGQQAFTRAQQIHLERGVDLESGRGELVVAHELAHVVQQRSGGERPGTQRQLEREAQRAASLAAQGQLARIALRAQPAGVYAFSEDSGHDEDATSDAGDASHSDDALHADHDTHEAKGDEAETNTHDGAKAEAAAPQPAAETAGHDDDATGGADEEKLDINIDVIPAEGGDAGAPSVGGGGGAAKPKKEPPNVAAAKPEAGLAQLHGVRPDKLAPVLGQVHTAASADAAKERAKQQANPPKQMSTGNAASPMGGKEKDGGLGAEGAPSGKKNAKDGPEGAPSGKKDAKDGAERPIKGEVPGGEAAKKAQQGKAQDQQKTAGQAITQAGQSIRSFFTSLWPASGGGGSANGNATAMSDAQAQNMAGSVGNLSTKASVSTDAGPPPEIAMKSEAKSSADRDRAQLESKTAAQQSQGRADATAPMGEDHIETTVAAEELSAKPMPGGGAAGPDAALPTLEGAASSEEAGIVAKEQSGAEIDAALSKASADVTAERGKQSAEEAKARADSDRQITELKSKAEADQAAARTAAQAEVQASRTQWKSEIDAKGADARKQADKKISEGMTLASAEETKANAEAKQHIDEGQKKAEDEKQKGEKEAADAKAKGKEKSSGFFGWLADKAKAAFDGIKKAVSAAIDACKRAVKAVIDAAKKLAMAAIELARKAITAAIKAIGAALVAISDVLLAAFPELKAKFQAAIRKAVDKAVNAVNKLADALKKGVQKALDMLGAALDKALSLLGKGINAIVDAANAIVQGAIKAAQAVVEALGTWAKLLKDIASGPGAWIGKLGAAVIDGIKNHLWSAFKTAVVEWFKGKVFELLGVGGIILELLLEGGLTREHIIQMALDALMVAIPAALVAILIEKLVSMIVPAAGAVMAIIEGLQAAWGTISRIIAAFAAFMAFLLAVKGGGAGALFAAVLASAAVVVLDFVANWLLKKLMSAARKVGAKLKGLAEKFKSKRKAKKDAKAAKKHKDDHDGSGGKKKDHDDHDGPNGKKKTDKDDDNHAKFEKDKKKKEEKDKKNQEILAKAQRELPAKIKKVLDRGIRGFLLKIRLGVWKLQYRLSALEVTGGKNFQIRARVNPSAEIIGGVTMDVDELLAFVRQVTEKMRASERVKTEAAAIRGSEREKILPSPPEKGKPPRTAKEVDIPAGTSHIGLGEGLAQAGPLQRGKVREINALTAEGKASSTVRQQQPPFAPLTPEGTPRGSTQIVKEPSASGTGFEPGDYPAMAARLAPSLPPEARGPTVALALEEFARTGKAPAGFNEAQLHALRTTLFGAEHSRSPAASAFGQMSLDLMKAGATPEAILGNDKSGGLHPLSPKGVSEDRTALEERMKKVEKREKVGEPNAAEKRQMDREVELIKAWLKTLTDLKFSDQASMAEKEQQIKDEIERRMMKSVE